MNVVEVEVDLGVVEVQEVDLEVLVLEVQDMADTEPCLVVPEPLYTLDPFTVEVVDVVSIPMDLDWVLEWECCWVTE